MEQIIYSFGKGRAQGNQSLNCLLGGKGANLAEMSLLGLPVPPGFTITTEVCKHYYKSDKIFPENINSQILTALKEIEQIMGLEFGSNQNPLLLSVRSGAQASMPGMMDTILNLGLNDETVKALSKPNDQNAKFAYDCYRRFIQMYGYVVLEVDGYLFEEILEEYKEDNQIQDENELSLNVIKDIIEDYKKLIKKHTHQDFPQNVFEQLTEAIKAVFNSWMSKRAIIYRDMHYISAEAGTAVNIQAMVFGNLSDQSATGVCFTRDPSTGDSYIYGEYLLKAQGEEVVSGLRTPAQITEVGKIKHNSPQPSLENLMPSIYQDLKEIAIKLEKHFKDMQDIEFTIQDSKLWILQTRNGKRNINAAIKIAVDLVKENIITQSQAILQINPLNLDQMLHPTIDPNHKTQILTKGLPASPGAASGIIVFSSEEAERKVHAGNKVILVRNETSPEDINGMIVAQGILTARGGMTSHAAVVARGMGKPCICGANNIKISNDQNYCEIDNVKIKKGETITINGSNGEVFKGSVPTIQSNINDDFKLLMKWALSHKKLQVRTNAETINDIQTALSFGVEGIGLCRTEHMFFQADRIPIIRQMIIASNPEDRKKALDELLIIQQQDFEKIFLVMEELPVTIRLLDPPLHEFLPINEEEFKQIADNSKISIAKLKQIAHSMHETNPMLGHRGCRLAISYPEIYQMQVKAIINAAINIAKQTSRKLKPEIMVPLVMTKEEIIIIKKSIDETAQNIINDSGYNLEYSIGTMIELPRAALRAGDIAAHSSFFSFGTNDLTQTTLGISRDDAARFLTYYKEAKIFEYDPFIKLDEEGVGELIKIACERGKLANPQLKLGICGEHAGHPDAIKFCHNLGLDYVSCSPFRVPIAILAAAQANIK